MITAQGKRFIKRYLAGQSSTFAGAISVGIGNAAASLNDAMMGFELDRVPIDISAYDFNTDRLIFKGSLSDDLAGQIYEVGLWTLETDPTAGNQASRLITTFDSATENWDIATFDSLVTRIGEDSLKHTPAASASATSNLTGVIFDFIENTGADQFVFAYNVDNANTSSIKFRFCTDSSNYYEFVISSPTAGYKFTYLSKSAAAVTGAPAWDDINQITVVTTAKSTGAASVEYDGIRIEDTDSSNVEYGMIARFVLPAPIIKESGLVKDIEYSLGVDV